MKKPTKEIKAVIAWMENQMYEEHTKWTYGNEHDSMSDARDFLLRLVQNKKAD